MKLYLSIGFAALVALAGSFAAGRFTTPTKTVEVTKTQFVDRVVTAEVAHTVQVAGPVRIVTRTVERPAGPAPKPGCDPCEPIHETTVTEDHGSITTTTDQVSTSEHDSSGSSETSKTVEVERPQWAIEGGGIWRPAALQLRPERVELAVSRRVLGPAWLTVSADAPTDQLGDPKAYRAGLRLRVEF